MINYLYWPASLIVICYALNNVTSYLGEHDKLWSTITTVDNKYWPSDLIQRYKVALDTCAIVAVIFSRALRKYSVIVYEINK